MCAKYVVFAIAQTPKPPLKARVVGAVASHAQHCFLCIACAPDVTLSPWPMTHVDVTRRNTAYRINVPTRFLLSQHELQNDLFKWKYHAGC